MRKFLKELSGQGYTEYILLITLIFAACISSVQLFEQFLGAAFLGGVSKICFSLK